MAMRWTKLAGDGALSAFWVLKSIKSRLGETMEVDVRALDAKAK